MKPNGVAHSDTEAYSSPAGFAGKPSTDCVSVHMVTFLSHDKSSKQLVTQDSYHKYASSFILTVLWISLWSNT